MICPETEEMPRYRRRGLAVTMGTVGALMLGILVAEAGGLRVNATASMPRGIWRVEVAGARIERGEVVSVCPPDSPAIREAARRGYIPAGACPGGREPLIKPVAAIPGDLVTVTARGIAVNGEPVGDSGPLEKDSAGRPLRPIPAGAYRVPAGAVWLLSGHDLRSFDSRYFGAVPVANIQGIARPVWVVE
jgi:conjugative transfer signal peptidase TraF